MYIRFRVDPGQAANLRLRVYSQDRATLVATFLSSASPNPFTEQVSGSYRCDVGNITGSPWFVQISYIDTDEIAADGFVGSDGELRADLLGDIQSKTDLLTSNTVQVSVPVAINGSIAEIVIGDDYLAANNRSFYWTVPAVAGMSVGSVTCWFGGEAQGSAEGSWLVQGAVTDVGGGNWKIEFNLTGERTAACAAGFYSWSAAIHDQNGVEITKVRKGKNNQTQLVRKYTNQ